MNPQKHTPALIDGILRFLAIGGTVSASLLLPGLAIGLEKPLNKYLNKLDEKTRQREFKRILSYMKGQNLIAYGKFEHGITITNKGKKRLTNAHINQLRINRPVRWDKKWRLVIFDIPEQYKTGRDTLTAKLRELQFQPLQRSVWIHPFSCHEEIEAITMHYGLSRYVTYIETSFIDKPDILKKRFSKLIR